MANVYKNLQTEVKRFMNLLSVSVYSVNVVNAFLRNTKNGSINYDVEINPLAKSIYAPQYWMKLLRNLHT
jgi:hypothetical protein